MTGMRRWAVIEFIGLPGVGKSALSHRIADILERRGWRVEQPTYATDHELSTWERYLLKLRLVAAEVMRHPWRAWRSLRAIAMTRQARAMDFVGVSVNWLFVSALLRRAQRRGGVHLFDEGLLNTLWSVGFSANAADTVAILGRLAREAPPPLVATFLEADHATIRQRLGRRKNGHSRLEQTGMAEGDWSRAHRALEQVKATVQLLVDGGEDLRIITARNQERERLDALAGDLAAAFEDILTARVSRC